MKVWEEVSIVVNGGFTDLAEGEMSNVLVTTHGPEDCTPGGGARIGCDADERADDDSKENSQYNWPSFLTYTSS